MTTEEPEPAREQIHVNGPTELIAAVPYLFGFHPVDSLVVLGLSDPDMELRIAMRFDVPLGMHHREATDYLINGLITHDSMCVAIVVITGRGTDVELPHRQLVHSIRSELTAAGIGMVSCLWTEATATGASWTSYEDAESGRLPDPTTTVLAAAHVAAGVVTHPGRGDIDAMLAPASEEVLDRRARLLQDRLACVDFEPPALVSRARLQSVRSAIDHAIQGELPADDATFVDLILALYDRRVHDILLLPDDNQQRAAATETLLIALVRGTPPPERAEPAACLAVAAYLRGDGVLAQIALEHAHDADPDHHLTELLRAALHTMLAPAQLREIVQKAAAASRWRLGIVD